MSIGTYSSRSLSRFFLFLSSKPSKMEEWQLDFEWLKVRHLVQSAMQRKELPDLNGILFLIGMQEYGHLRDNFTKEEKQDLMHVAICRLLSQDGYYGFVGRDEEGWPHYKVLKPFRTKGVKEQSRLIKEKIIEYFQELGQENGGWEE